MKLKTISLFALALLVVFACQTEAQTKKVNQSMKEGVKKKQTPEADSKDPVVLISGADSILISKRKVVDEWDKEWSKVVYQFYNASQPLAKWQIAINNFIRKGLYRTDGQAPYTAPLSAELIHQSLLAFKKEAQPYAEEGIWNMTDTFQIDDHFASFACVKWYSSSFTGGAHGMYGLGYYYFDKASAKTLGLKDLLRLDESLLKQAEGLFRKSVGIKANTPFENTEFSFGGPFYLPDNFKITAKEIRFIYNPYEVSNWANGVVEFSIPIAQIKPYLKREI